MSHERFPISQFDLCAGRSTLNVKAALIYSLAPGTKAKSKKSLSRRGVFFANSKKDYPRAAEIIRKAMIERGLLAPGQATDTASDSAAPSK